jgi:hypothetical protein
MASARLAIACSSALHALMSRHVSCVCCQHPPARYPRAAVRKVVLQGLTAGLKRQKDMAEAAGTGATQRTARAAPAGAAGAAAVAGTAQGGDGPASRPGQGPAVSRSSLDDTPRGKRTTFKPEGAIVLEAHHLHEVFTRGVPPLKACNIRAGSTSIFLPLAL